MRGSGFIKNGRIEGVVIKELPCHRDNRGSLIEFFRTDEIEKAIYPAMGYVSFTNPHTTRGPHEHLFQTDYFFFPGIGSFILAAWDNRAKSPSYMCRAVILIEPSKPIIAIVPPGVVHGYHCVSDAAGLVINAPNKLYKGQDKRETADEVRHEDDPASPFVVDFSATIENTP